MLQTSPCFFEAQPFPVPPEYGQNAYLGELGFADIGAATVGNWVALSMANVKSAREVIKWSEQAYGPYEW